LSDETPREAPASETATEAATTAAPGEAAPDAEPANEPSRGAPAAGAHPPRELRRFAFLAVPLVALLELGAHLVQTHSVVSEAEWLAARDAVRAVAKPEDLVVVAPAWADPVARELWKDEVLTLAREARPDATRFPRAVEASIRGQHERELAGWKVESAKRVGPVTVTVYDNPAYAPLKDDLVDHVAPGKMAVSVVSGGGASDCQLTQGRVETGPLGFGPAIPRVRFACPQGGMLAATVFQPGDYRPHRCLFTPPLGPGKTLRVRFLDVPFGTLLHGHAGIDWDSTAHTEEGPVTLVWKVGDRTLGRITAGNDDGWKGFALDTREVAGQTGELVAEVSSNSARNRLYCFEADTR
jgi:hypothetical protein